MPLLVWFTLLFPEISITKQDLSCLMGNQRMPYSSWIRCSLESSLLRMIHKHLFVQTEPFRWGIKSLEKLWISEVLQVTNGLILYWRKAKKRNHSAIGGEEGRSYLLMCKSYLFGLVYGFVLCFFIYILLTDSIS